ncbi:MAG: hypothetical protein PVI57_00720 [Gemmatimonadota bacterium]
METLVAVLAFAVLFGLFAVSRVAERTRPCKGRKGPGEERCGACPLRAGPGDRFGACPGPGERPDA